MYFKKVVIKWNIFLRLKAIKYSQLQKWSSLMAKRFIFDRSRIIIIGVKNFKIVFPDHLADSKLDLIETYLSTP